MSEVWLHSNRRVLLLAMVPAIVLGSLGLWMLLGGGQFFPGWLGIGCLVLAFFLLGSLVRQVFQPRIAYREGEVLFYLKARGPFAVPVHVIEAFFQGEGPAHLPGEANRQTKSVNLIARLSQRETDWQTRNVKAALGAWAEGYITIRGTWCEPIDGDVIRRLNRRLREVTEENETRTQETQAQEPQTHYTQTHDVQEQRPTSCQE